DDDDAEEAAALAALHPEDRPGGACARLREADGSPCAYADGCHLRVVATQPIRGTRRRVLVVERRDGAGPAATWTGRALPGESGEVSVAFWLAIADDDGAVRFALALTGAELMGTGEIGVRAPEVRTGTYPGVGVVAAIRTGYDLEEHVAGGSSLSAREDTALCAVGGATPRCVGVPRVERLDGTEADGSEVATAFEQTLNVTDEGVRVRVTKRVGRKAATEPAAGLPLLPPGEHAWTEVFPPPP
ncbi:MAG: hypothetical protein KC635_30195, partial [Myxococcales bacterium]|nr:hypothetical protein [Myxococcales bacterium]